MSHCKDCKHYKSAPVASLMEAGYHHGECLIKMGDQVTIEIDSPPFSGGIVESVSVHAGFGCKAWEAKDD